MWKRGKTMPNPVFVITEAASRVGKTLTRELAQREGTLVLVAREADSGAALQEEIARTNPETNLDLQLCDLSILSSVRNLAEILRLRYEAVDMLINTAAVRRRNRMITVDGFETTFAANYLGPFLLTNLLLEPLQAAAQARGSAQVLNIVAPSLSPVHLDDLDSEREFKGSDAFGASQTALLLFTFELARRLANTGILVNAIHSSSVKSHSLERLLGLGVRESRDEILQAATAAQSEGRTGKFLRNGKEINAPAYAQDQAVQQKLWELSETLTGLAANRGDLPVNDPHL
jgi:NAD(P)-dependent dehydrogenase (short-subunit alcohol dehydrogenase family)